MSETMATDVTPSGKFVEIDTHSINFGPQHPAAHGVLRLILELDGEVVERACWALPCRIAASGSGCCSPRSPGY